MTTDLRSALRIAHRVRHQLLEAHARRIVDASQQLERWRVRADHLRHPNRHALLARDNRWAAGARRSANAARRQLRELSCDLPAIQRMYEQIAEVQVPALRDLLGELDQIEDEFGGWRLQPNPIRLCVCTSAAATPSAFAV